MRIAIVLGDHKGTSRCDVPELIALSCARAKVLAWSVEPLSEYEGMVRMTPHGAGLHPADMWWSRTATDIARLACVVVLNYAGPTAAEYLLAAGVPVISMVDDLTEFGTAEAWKRSPATFNPSHVVVSQECGSYVLRNGGVVKKLQDALAQLELTLTNKQVAA